MGTACRLARMTPNGIQAIFVNYDGDRLYMDPMLMEYYTDPATVDLLFSKGALISVHKYPVFPENYVQRVRKLKSLIAYDSLAYIYGVTTSYSELHLEAPEDAGNYQSIKEFIDQYHYFYDVSTRTWYTGERDKDDFYNRDKIKMVKCKRDTNRAQILVASNRLNNMVKNGEYMNLKDALEPLAPITCHYSKDPKKERYYITLGNSRIRSNTNTRLGWYENIPRKDTKKVIFRCNTLQELLSWTVAFLWSL